MPLKRIAGIIGLLLCIETSTVNTLELPSQKMKAPDIEKMELSMDNLVVAMKYHGIQHKEIVLAQAILETGWFKSDNCVKNNNLFGLYDSKNKRYYKFKHWTCSVEAYKSKFQYKYKTGNYYDFLQKKGYAEDPDYVKKVKNIVIREKLKEKTS